MIAAVNGVAAGAGANLALACDLVFAARSASFIESFAKLGLIPDTGGTWVLPRLVGLARAMGQHWRLSRAEWRTVIVFGLCQNALYLGLNWVAMQYVEASAAAIIASVMPLAVAFGRDYPEFWMQTPINGQPATLGNGSHFGFVAPDKASVHAFHEAALAAGGQDEGQQIDIQPLQLTVLVLHAKGRPEVGHHP